MSSPRFPLQPTPRSQTPVLWRKFLLRANLGPSCYSKACFLFSALEGSWEGRGSPSSFFPHHHLHQPGAGREERERGVVGVESLTSWAGNPPLPTGPFGGGGCE